MSRLVELHGAADELNEIIVDIEEALVARYRTRAKVPFIDDLYLVFKKFGKSGWHIGVVTEGHDPTPISNVSLKQKMAAVRYLPKLWTALREQQGAMFQDIRDTTELARSFFNSLDQTPLPDWEEKE